jgi:hypothetical protein
MPSTELPCSDQERTKRHKLASPLTRCADDVLRYNVQEVCLAPLLDPLAQSKRPRKADLVPRY